jgi:hypothetical protein
MARKPNAWSLFVKKVHKDNPGKTLGQCMKIASTLKKQGKMPMGKMTMGKSIKTKGKGKKSRRR